MSDQLKIEDAPGWVKNSSSKAILNTNITALQEYKAKKRKDNQLNTIDTEVDLIKSEIDELKSDIKDIKDILQQFIQLSKP